MAHLANNPGQQDAGEILLSGFTQMALQIETQRRLMKPGSKPRRGKKGQKKQPQRGLGVAQLEKIRLEEQRRASQAQHLAALGQLHSESPLYTHSNAPHMPTSASIIQQFERESNLSPFLIPVVPATSSALAHCPSIDSITNSFLFKSVSPFRSNIARSITPATPLDLFPGEKFAATSSTRASDRTWSDRNFYTQQAPGEGRALGESPPSLLSLTCNQSNESQDDGGGPGYPLINLQWNSTSTNTSIIDLWHPSQVPSRTASPSFNLERMMELSSFQSTVSSRGDQHAAFKKWAWGVLRPGSQPAELPMWMSPSFPHSKSSQEYQSHGSSDMDVCELTLMPLGAAVPPSVLVKCGQQQQLCTAQGRNSFLSLAIGSTWQDSMAESSSTPSPASATTTKSSANDASTTDENMSPPVTSWSSLPSFFSMDSGQSKDLQISLFSSFDTSLDLTLKL